MNNIDKVYYINLDHRVDRRKEIEGVLDELDVPQEKRHRISAVYTPRAGALGCSKSHILAIEDFIKSGLNTCMILEDDFIYETKDHFNQSLEYVFTKKIEFDVLQLAYNHLNKMEYEDTEYTMLKRVRSASTTSGYILHKTFAPTLLLNFEESYSLNCDYHMKNNSVNHFYCLDVYWQLLQRISTWYCFMPRLGYQRESYSDVEEKLVNYNC